MSSRPGNDPQSAPSRDIALESPGDRGDVSAEYRRRARRLRCRMADRPALLQAALAELARREDARQVGPTTSLALQGPQALPRVSTDRTRVRCVRTAHRSGSPPEASDPFVATVAAVSPEAEERFTRLTEQALADGILPFPRRQQLQRAARRLGLGRFQANLLIAAVQHRYDWNCAASRVQIKELATPGRQSPWLRLAAAVLTLQLLLAAFAWWMIHV